jgi:glycosyltransferase involved in cell wall biosynthesis
VSHEATLTGAPIVLLHLLRWLRSNSNLDVEVMLRKGGPIAKDFRAAAPIVNVRLPEPRTVPGRILKRLALPPDVDDGVVRSPLEVRTRTALGAEIQRRRQAPRHWDLAYLNTIVSSAMLPFIDESTRVLAHVHEFLDQPSIAQWMAVNAQYIIDLKRRDPRFLAVGERVKNVLVSRLDVDPSSVEVCHEFIPTGAHEPHPDAVARVRRELGISEGTMVVGASGTMDWRKGVDLFVQVAGRIRALGLTANEIRFVWLGGNEDPLQPVRYDIERMGLSEMIHLVPATPDPRPYFAAFDVFALSSRTDPFPLVCLEAAALGKPIVCFDCGGIPEFVEQDCGFVVPYADVQAMAERIDQLRDDTDLRARMGLVAAVKVRARHDVEVAAPGILESIERALR